MSDVQQGREVAAVSAIISGVIKDLPFLADLQWHERRSSLGLNRKLFGILPNGVFEGFNLKAATGLNLTITSKGTENGIGTASNSVYRAATEDYQAVGYQLTIHQFKDVDVPLVAGKLNIIVVNANYNPEDNVITEQVKPDSPIKAVEIHVLHDEKDPLFKHGVELGRVNVPAGATAIKDADIDISKRRILSVGTNLAETTGQSRVSGMTQKAITDELDRIDDALLSKDSDAIPDWNKEFKYKQNAIVKESGVFYIAKKDNVNKSPSKSPDDWMTLSDYLKLDSYATYEWIENRLNTVTILYTAKGGEKEITLPVVPNSILIDVNGLIQHKDYSYIIENKQVKIVSDSLLEGDRVQIILNPMLSAVRNSEGGAGISKDKGNSLIYGSDGGVYLNTDELGFIKEVSVRPENDTDEINKIESVSTRLKDN